MEGEKLSS